MNYCHVESPVGTLLIACDDEAIRRIEFSQNGQPAPPERDWNQSSSGLLREAAEQLNEYFTGSRTVFTVPLGPEGTEFQSTVWRHLRNIPYGQTISYGELAKWLGKPKASRAVGAANGSNPIPIMIPCHRVIGSDGKLTGFGGGLPAKKALLTLEALHKSQRQGDDLLSGVAGMSL
jgi:methylated-DNA-[protein]-cysteine S-methyltransferase